MTRMVVEVCPHCELEIEMRWDPERDGYKTFCPNCGERLMLCDECMHSEDPEYGSCDCDYCTNTDSCKHNPVQTKEAVLRDRLVSKVERDDGILYDRVCHFSLKKSNLFGCSGCTKRTKCNFKIIARLSEYEDTGLTPEGVKELKKIKEKLV